MIYDVEMETLPREDLEALQLRRLKRSRPGPTRSFNKPCTRAAKRLIHGGAATLVAPLSLQ